VAFGPAGPRAAAPAEVPAPVPPEPPAPSPEPPAPSPQPTGLDLVGVDGIRVARALVPYVQALRSRAQELGATFHLTSGYRSVEQQQSLRVRWEAGDPSVLAPPAKNSLHLLGLAVDLESNALPQLGAYAESIGMRWGGRFQDPVHFDLGRR
jgi:uncharacterized protein YcbK (DUF882 family)